MRREDMRDVALEMIRACDPTEAEMIQEMLQNNGIDSTLQGKESAEILPATGNLDEVRIWVKPADAARAREMVDAFFPGNVDETERKAS